MLEPKQIYKRIEAVFEGLEPRGSAEHFASRFVPFLIVPAIVTWPSFQRHSAWIAKRAR